MLAEIFRDGYYSYQITHKNASEGVGREYLGGIQVHTEALGIADYCAYRYLLGTDMGKEGKYSKDQIRVCEDGLPVITFGSCTVVPTRIDVRKGGISENYGEQDQQYSQDYVGRDHPTD